MNHGRISFFASYRWLFVWLVSFLAVGDVAGQYEDCEGTRVENTTSPTGSYHYTITVNWSTNTGGTSTVSWNFNYTGSNNIIATSKYIRIYTAAGVQYNSTSPSSGSTNIAGATHIEFGVGGAAGTYDFEQEICDAPPDICGPVNLSQMVVNQTPFTQTWMWQTGDSSLLISSSNGASTLGPFQSGTFTLVDSDLCGPIYLIEVGGLDAIPGEATDFYGPFQPDSPDEAPADDPVIVDAPVQPVEFEDTALQEIEDDVALDDQQKTARQDYVLWRASDSRGAEIVAELKKLNEGGLGEDGTAAIVSELEEHNEREQARQDAQDAILEGNPSSGEQASAGAAAKADIEDVYPNSPTSLGYDPGSGVMPLLTVTMPAAFGGATFDMNPFQSERLKPVTDWFRVGVAWLAIVTLGVWVWGEIGEWTRGFSTLQQAKGNAIAAGSGGQATAFIAAGLITVAIVTGTVALIGWAFGDLDVYLFVSTATSNPMATMPAGVYWLLDQVFPIATLLAALVARLSFRMFAAPLFAGVAGVVRFVVP